MSDSNAGTAAQATADVGLTAAWRDVRYFGRLSATIRVLAAALALSLMVTMTYADEAPPQRLPTVVVVAEPDACAQADAAQASYDCLNAELAALVARQSNQQGVLKVVKASALPRTSTEQGLYNQTAVRIRMGNTFGRSVYPQRPVRAASAPLTR